MGSGAHPALMMDSANCSLVQVSGTWYLLPKKQTPPNYCHLLSWWQLCVSVWDVSVQEAKTEGGVSYTCSLVGMLDLAACLPLALHYPAGKEGLGMHPDVFAPAQSFPRGQTAAADPRSAHDQTRAQMFHAGAMWCLVAHHYLSDACLTAGAGSNHVSLLRTSQTLTTPHLSWHSFRGIGLTPCHYTDRQSSSHHNEPLQWGQRFLRTLHSESYLLRLSLEQEVKFPRQ